MDGFLILPCETTIIDVLPIRYSAYSRPSSIVVSDATLTAVPQGLGSNPGEGMDVCKRIVSSRHGRTINCLRAASPPGKLLEGEERWEAPDHLQVSSLKIWVETSQIVLSPVWCSTGVT
ncbi:hypothetical protein TNCV_2676031 [Trichonephila clavipes]|nr:hypothetical protein TNCV_2676031 [Trichonephila clavipes]